MNVSYIKMDVAELRSSRAPKYDVMLKMVFSLEGSSLRDMLSIPPGLSLSEEFPDLEGLRIDSLTLAEGRFYHLEFQAKNHPEMLHRMAQYALKIRSRPDLQMISNGSGVPLQQTVLYVGTATMAMINEFYRDGRLAFRFGLDDIRFFYDRRRSLEDSLFPEDWVLSLLVARREDHDDKDWIRVANRMNSELDPGDPRTAEFRTILLIASILRDVDWDIQEEIAAMIEIDASSNRLLKQVFEQGMDAAYPIFLLAEIRDVIRRDDLTIDSGLMEHIESADVDEIKAFSNELNDAPNRQAFLDARGYGY
ncbi:hypothetical protein [Rhizobium leguminosarum]|uniref:hypothetical protein n=1 Tax=Rhizobium leguminosarum TaxID=384 RepID=UPI001441890E|nr:hypothetical protein [Rhizobium leguminosarum]NKL77648.1 hypothetical protein [Rhizobium leguminosarum bv. viciae]